MIVRLPLWLVRRLFNLLYGPLAPIYDWVSRTFFLGQWTYWQQAPLDEIEGRVLEVGAGTGALMAEAERRQLDWIALEVSAAMIRQARRRSRRLGIQPRIVRGDVRALPFRSGRFNRLVSTFPTEYIINPEALAEFGRVTAQGGKILIVPAAMLRPTEAIGRLLDRLHQLVYGGPPRPVSLPGPEGFAWETRWVDSPRGRAILLIGGRQLSAFNRPSPIGIADRAGPFVRGGGR